MRIYTILALAILFNASANVLIKVAMNRTGTFALNVSELVTKVLFNPVALCGIGCFVIALALYAYVLTNMNLSIAYPIMTSLGYCIVISISWLFLKENITWVQLVGFAAIILGIWLVAR